MPIQVAIIGGGMITQDQLLPSVYQLQRLGVVGKIQICARHSAPLRVLAQAPDLQQAFPGMGFDAFPPLSEDPAKVHPDIYKQVIAALPPHNLVVCATPDPTHFEIIKFALEHNQHVLAVKPLVHQHRQAMELKELAYGRGLFVGIEYHKRFDARSLEARKNYRAGRFGEFRLGQAKLIEPWYYRHSNFQNWFTCENTDPFTYIGCHYVDLVYFITGLRPVQISLLGVRDAFPNGNIGYLWSNGRVLFENGGILSVLNGLGYPDQGAGSNDQGITLFCQHKDAGGVIAHDDQNRGVTHCYADGKTRYPFRYISPDYFRLVPWQGEGLCPTGYGFWSVQAIVQAAIQVNQAGVNLTGGEALAARQALLAKIDSANIIATPSNSAINELVVEAARMSIQDNGRAVNIRYDPHPCVV